MKFFENDVAYIVGWLNRLKNDKCLLVFARSKAQQAVDFILNVPINEMPEETNKGDEIIKLFCCLWC